MSDKKSTPIHALNEATNSRAGMTVGSLESVSGRMMSDVMEACALYGAAHYPLLMHSTRGTSPVHHGSHLPGRASGRVYGPGYAGNEMGVNDNLRALPPLICDSAVRSSKADSPLSAGKVAGGLTDSTRAAAAYLWNLWCRIRREREIARSIALLSRLDDRTLHDIGVHRSQIAHAVRYGRDESA
jgi:uncharacterized protein YjiS (DUF1127 family)